VSLYLVALGEGEKGRFEKVFCEKKITSEEFLLRGRSTVIKVTY